MQAKTLLTLLIRELQTIACTVQNSCRNGFHLLEGCHSPPYLPALLPHLLLEPIVLPSDK